MLKKSYTFQLALFFIFFGNTYAQEKYPDLIKMDKREGRDKAWEIIDRVNSYDISSQEKAYDSLEFLVTYFSLDSLRITTYIKRGRYELLAHQDVKKALQYFTNAKELAVTQNDKHKELSALAQIAQLYSQTSINDKAVETLKELKEKAELLGDSVRISSAYFQLAISNPTPSDYSVQMFKKSLQYSPVGAHNLARIYGNLGHTYILKTPKDIDSAQYYLEIANVINDSLRSSPGIPLTLSEVYILQNEYEKADSLINKILEYKGGYDAYDFSLLTYYLKIRVLQHHDNHVEAVKFVDRGVNKLKTNYFDDYEIVDFCRTSKKSLIAVNNFELYKVIDSIETSSQDSLRAYIEEASVSKSERSLEMDSLEKEISEKESEIEYKNIALMVLGASVLLMVMFIYQIRKKRQLKYQLIQEEKKVTTAEIDRKALEQQKMKSDANVTKLEGEMVEKIQQQERQLASHVLSLTHKNNILHQALAKIQEARKQNGSADLNSLEKLLETNLKNEDQWKTFLIHFENVHPGFYDKLKGISKDITKQDRRMLSYIKMQLSSKEIAQLLGVNYESVNTSRYRLRKKLNLPKDTELDDYIARL